jgi:ABC-2 type transport system ATP-binding protein
MTPSTPTMIELRRLLRIFGSTRAVDDVTFTVERGQVFGFIGPNGAGKTTTMRILATLDLPTAGDALVDGFSVINDPDRVRRRLGFMPDYFGTYDNVNCREYLDFFARAYDLRGSDRVKAIGHTMEFTGLDQLADKPMSALSKGMKQRLCLGRAMIHDPGVLVLDEPAAGLDPRARIELRGMIRALAENGKTVLVSSHILTELAEMCDVVGIIEQGHLLAVGTVEEIRRRATGRHDESDAHRRVVKVEVIDDGNALARDLEGRDDLEEVGVEGEFVTFSHSGDREFEADLLRWIIENGHRVVDFGSHEVSLEDLFLQVTTGQVQ